MGRGTSLEKERRDAYGRKRYLNVSGRALFADLLIGKDGMWEEKWNGCAV
jgi:hypothetical protein